LNLDPLVLALGVLSIPKSLIVNSCWLVRIALEPSNKTCAAYLTNIAID
jgi:hypothetical protein